MSPFFFLLNFVLFCLQCADREVEGRKKAKRQKEENEPGESKKSEMGERQSKRAAGTKESRFTTADIRRFISSLQKFGRPKER